MAFIWIRTAQTIATIAIFDEIITINALSSLAKASRWNRNDSPIDLGDENHEDENRDEDKDENTEEEK